MLSVRASRAPSRRVFAYRTREAYRHRLLCTGGMHTADIIFHRHRAATGIGNGSTRSTDGNPEPRERQRRSGGLRLVLSRKSSKVVRDRTIAGTTRLVKSTHRCGPNRPAGAPTRGGRGSGFEVECNVFVTAWRYRIYRPPLYAGNTRRNLESRGRGLEYLVSRFYFEILLHLCPSVSRREVSLLDFSLSALVQLHGICASSPDRSTCMASDVRAAAP